MLHQRGKALYNNYEPEFKQFRRPEFQLKSQSEFSKSNLPTELTKNNDYSSKSDSINPVYQSNIRLDSLTTQLNSRELRLRQDNQAFKDYMINLCKSYIDNIEFRNKIESNTKNLIDPSELVKLYGMLISSTQIDTISSTQVKQSKFQGGYEYQRNYSCTFTDTNGKSDVNIKWSIDEKDYAVLSYSSSVNGSTTKEYHYIVGDDDNEGVISNLMNILNPILAHFHSEDLKEFKIYTPFHFNYQVISFLNYYLNKDFNYFKQTKYMLILSTIRYHMNQLTKLTNGTFEIKNTITNMFSFIFTHGEIFGDCALNSHLASVNPTIRKYIVEYFIKDYYNTTNESQQLRDLSDKIKQELNEMFNNMSNLFPDFVNEFKNESDVILRSFVNNPNITGKIRVDELAKLYVSILLVQTKINHLFNMIIKAPKLNLNVLSEAFAYHESHRNCIGDIVAEKYSDSNKHYLTLPVGLYKIAHAVLLVIERNDINGSNPDDRAYVIDLNDMSILYNQLTSEYKTKEDRRGSMCLSNKPTPIMAERLTKCKLKFSGIVADYHEIDNRFTYSTKMLGRFYEKYILMTKYHQKQIKYGYYYGYFPVISKLFNCNIDETTFNLNQRIFNDVVNMIPNPFQTRILNNTRSFNVMNLFSVVVNCFIEYFNSIHVIIPWEYIITGVNNLSYPYLFFVVYCIYMTKSRNNPNIVSSSISNIVSVDEYYNTMLDDIEKYDDYVDKLSTLLYHYRNDIPKLKKELDQLCNSVESGSDKYWLKNNIFGISYMFILHHSYKLIDKPITEAYIITDLIKNNSLITSTLKQLNSNERQHLINIIESNQTNTYDFNKVEFNVETLTDIMNCIGRLNNLVGIPGRTDNSIINPNPIDQYLTINKYQPLNELKVNGGIKITSLDTIVETKFNIRSIVQQLLVFLLVLVIVVIVIVLVVKGVNIITDSKNK